MFETNRKVSAAGVLADNSPGLFKQENSFTAVMNQENRTAPTVFTIKPVGVQPSRTVESNTFYDSLKPFIFVLRAMGVSPVLVSSKGNYIHNYPAITCELM
jgi:hypothetical protein